MVSITSIVETRVVAQQFLRGTSEPTKLWHGYTDVVIGYTGVYTGYTGVCTGYPLHNNSGVTKCTYPELS